MYYFLLVIDRTLPSIPLCEIKSCCGIPPRPAEIAFGVIDLSLRTAHGIMFVLANFSPETVKSYPEEIIYERVMREPGTIFLIQYKTTVWALEYLLRVLAAVTLIHGAVHRSLLYLRLWIKLTMFLFLFILTDIGFIVLSSLIAHDPLYLLVPILDLVIVKPFYLTFAAIVNTHLKGLRLYATHSFSSSGKRSTDRLVPDDESYFEMERRLSARVTFVRERMETRYLPKQSEGAIRGVLKKASDIKLSRIRSFQSLGKVSPARDTKSPGKTSSTVDAVTPKEVSSARSATSPGKSSQEAKPSDAHDSSDRHDRPFIHFRSKWGAPKDFGRSDDDQMDSTSKKSAKENRKVVWGLSTKFAAPKDIGKSDVGERTASPEEVTPPAKSVSPKSSSLEQKLDEQESRSRISETPETRSVYRGKFSWMSNFRRSASEKEVSPNNEELVNSQLQDTPTTSSGGRAASRSQSRPPLESSKSTPSWISGLFHGKSGKKREVSEDTHVEDMDSPAVTKSQTSQSGRSQKSLSQRNPSKSDASTTDRSHRSKKSPSPKPPKSEGPNG